MTLYTNCVTMKSMKRFILFISAFMFLANTFAVSAWAKPCIMLNEPSPIATMSDGLDVPPCHKQQENNKSPLKHCKGLCLCFHASINQTPILSDSTAFYVPFGHQGRLTGSDERLASASIAPVAPPPKHSS